MFHNNIVKISEKIERAEPVENLPPSYLTYRFLHNLHSIYYGNESENIWLLSIND